MILTDEELRKHPELRVCREMEVDPAFVPCRDERCELTELHRVGAKGCKGLRRARTFKRRTECPRCQSGVTYQQQGQHEFPVCTACSWRGYRTITRESE